MKRELGLDLPPQRFSTVGTYSMVWQMRQQAPAAHGTADLSTVHRLQLTPDEEGRVALDPKEYVQHPDLWAQHSRCYLVKAFLIMPEFSLCRYHASAFVPLAEVLEHPDYHPCLKQAVRDLFKADALAALAAAAAQDATASAHGPPAAKAQAEVALLVAARAFVAAHQAALPATEVTKVVFAGGKYVYM